MRCEQVRGLLNDYLEGTLNRGIAEAVAAHLRVCDSCRREHQFLSTVWRELASLPAEPAPADLHARIMTHVRAHTRTRQAQQRVLFWRWLGASAVAAALIALVFFVSQSGGGVQAGFGRGTTSQQKELTTPKIVGAHVEWRTLANGTRIPVLVAGYPRRAAAHLVFTTEPNAAPRDGQIVWQGELNPDRALELPLTPLMRNLSERVAMLWWSVEDRHRAFFVPAGYPPARRASVRLNASLHEALAQLASTYQTTIEWVPAEDGRNPKVVLEVQDATLQEALEKLLLDTGYEATATPYGWRVFPRT
ncbi:MAG: zf-HC2 domain-containing protein [Fimbriimonadales bacterium]